jgi:hypothetical protein
MYARWNVSQHPLVDKTDEIRDQTLKSIADNKICLPAKAQRRLVTLIRNDPSILLASYTKLLAIVHFVDPDELKVHVPKLNIECGTMDKVLKVKKKKAIWKCKFDKISFGDNAIETSKRRIHKETMRMSPELSAYFKSSLNGIDYACNICEKIDLEKQNILLFDLEYLHLVQYQAFPIAHQRWNSGSKADLLETIDETIVENIFLEKSFSIKESLDLIPNNCSLAAFLEKDVLLPHIKRSLRFPSSLKRRWKISHSGYSSCTPDPAFVQYLLNETINEFEIKFKLPVASISVARTNEEFLRTVLSKTNHTKNKWIFSKYKAYMLDWNPFKGMNLKAALEEDSSMPKSIAMPEMIMIPNNGYIKLSDITSNFKEVVEYKTLPIFPQIQEPDLHIIEGEPKTDGFETPECAGKLPPSDDEQSIPLGEALEEAPIGDHLVSDDFSSPISSIISPISTAHSVLVHTTHSQTSVAPKSRTTSAIKPSKLDSIILKKKRKQEPAQFDFNKKYPYLDILDQTTNATVSVQDVRMRREQTQGEKGAVASTEVYSHHTLAPPSPNAKLNGQSSLGNPHQNNVLETTQLNEEDNIESVPLFNLSPGEVINVFLNIKFAEKFGQAFLQFSQILELENQVYISEFSSLEQDRCISRMSSVLQLELDIYLNITCGVIFLRPINVYQVDIKTGETLLFQQIERIAIHIQSLIVVIIIEQELDENISCIGTGSASDEGSIAAVKDDKVVSFIHTAKNTYGIDVNIVNNDARIIAMKMVDLVCKYTPVDSTVFQWGHDNKFLEACGVANPFLQSYIQHRCSMEEFVQVGEVGRQELLADVCSEPLLDLINQSVEVFLRS